LSRGFHAGGNGVPPAPGEAWASRNRRLARRRRL